MPHPIEEGEAAPWFHARALDGRDRYAFDTAAGRPILLLLMGSARWAACGAALALLGAHRHLFDDEQASFFGVSIDPVDVAGGRIAQSLPGIRWFLDHDRAVSHLYGAIAAGDGTARYHPHWLLLDRSLRVVRRAPIGQGASVMTDLAAMIAGGEEVSLAPVLTVPRVFEPDVCRALIAEYERSGGRDSGFMREEDGITVERVSHAHKRRADCQIEDEGLLATLRDRLANRLKPQIARAFQFEATRIERWLVACYDGGEGGHFRAHRDNTTKGTAHRRFACTINLNAEEYEGGDLRFPEYGARTYRAPTGGAIVFSCGLLHEALPVTRGRRYAFLPFLYDEAGAALRERNLEHLDPALGGYRSGLAPEAVSGGGR